MQAPITSYYMVSCAHCKKSHRPCDKKLPSCTRCVEKGFQCEYNPPKKRKRPSSSKQTEKQSKLVKVDGDVSVKTLLDMLFHSSNRGNGRCDLVEDIPAMVPMISTYGTDFEAKVNKVKWYNQCCLLLFHAPVKQSDTKAVTAAAGGKANYFRLLFHFSKHDPTDIKRLEELTMQYSRQDVLDAAEYLFTIAKQKILEPDLFVRIATDYKLAAACIGLNSYILGKEGDVNEAKLFLNMAKVFLDNTASLMHMDLSMFSGRHKQDMEDLKGQARILNHAFMATESYMNQTRLLRTRGVERMEAFIAMMENLSHNYPLVPELRAFTAILRQKHSQQRLEGFINLCDILANDERPWSEEEKMLESLDFLFIYRKISFRYLKVVALYVEQDMPDCSHGLESLKRQYSQQVIEFVYNNLQLYLLYGVFSYRLTIIVCEFLLEQAAVVRQNVDSIPLYLSQLEMAKAIVDGLSEKYFSKSLSEMSSALGNEISKISDVLGDVQPLTFEVYEQHVLSSEESTAWMFNTISESSPKSNNLDLDPFLDLEDIADIV